MAFVRKTSGGVLFEQDTYKKDRRGPMFKGSFQLTTEDLKELIDLVKSGEPADFRIAMWAPQDGKEFYGLSIDKWKPDPSKAKKSTSFFDEEKGDSIKDLPF